MKETRLNELLTKATRPLRNNFLKRSIVVVCLLLLCVGASAQQLIHVTGTVVDHQGEALVGALVSVDKTGAIVNAKGEFAIYAPSNGVLKVSFLGYETQMINVNNQTSLGIAMKLATNNLEDLVVVGYGTQRVKDITNSIVAVDMAKLAELPVTSLSEALRGQIPGLTVSSASSRPGSAPSLSIRQSFDVSKDGGLPLPLIVIDDVVQTDPSDNNKLSMTSFNLLDPSEVESITVIRDGASAIYGSRASQGAIIVSTKRGKSGAAKISYSGKYSFNDAISHPKVLNTYEYGLFANSLIRAKDPLTSANKLFSDAELEQMKGINYNWLDKAWSSASSQQHSINMSGGSDKVTYFVGGSFLSQGANLGPQIYDRYTYRAGLNAKVASNLKLNASVSGYSEAKEKIFTKNGVTDSYGGGGDGEQSDYAILAHIPGYIPWSTNIGGLDYWVSPSYGPHQQGDDLTPTTSRKLASWNYFALADSGSKTNDDNFALTANLSLEYNLPYVKGLSFKLNHNRNYSSSSLEQFQSRYTLVKASNTWDTADKHLYSDQTTWGSPVEVKTGSRVLWRNVTTEQIQSNFFVNYNREFGPHSVTGMFSVERAESTSKSRQISYKEPLYGIYIGQSLTAGTYDGSDVKDARYGSLSYLGRANYNYDGRYLVQFVFRSDASVKFAPQNYWGFFPSVSLGWVASEESWFKENVNWVNYMKIRASVGLTGKDNVKAWRWMQLYSMSQDKALGFGSTGGGTLTQNFQQDASPNVNIKWDNTTKYNVGLDFNFLDSRLTTSVDGYFDRTTNLITNMQGQLGVPISVGGAFAEQNYASIDAWGTEISVSWRDKIGEVSYNVGVNLGFGGNKYKKYFTTGNKYPSENQIKEGYTTYKPYWGFKTWNNTSSGDGILRTQEDVDNYWQYLTDNANATGNPLAKPQYFGILAKTNMKPGMLAYQDLGGVLNADGTQQGSDGVIQKEQDYAKLKNKNKSYDFTTNLGVSWKGISFSTQIATSWGSFNSIDFTAADAAKNIWSHELYNRDMFDVLTNPNGKYPNMQYGDNRNSSDFWELPSFRCYIRSMNIGYTVPQKWLSKVKISRATVSLAGHNLWDFYNPYPDKYRNMYDSPNSPYPTLRTWALGLDLSF